jgi:LysR family transcriptional regulator for bpeEF and oprC
MDLNLLSQFIRAMDAGSFTRAAERLRQPKSRVARNVAALERELGVQLIYRTTRQFAPTEAGRELYEQSRHLVTQLEANAAAIHDRRGEVSGKLHLTAATDLGAGVMSPLISEVVKKYPLLDVRLTLTNEYLDLVKEGMDLAIRVGQLEDTALRSKKIGEVCLILVASPKYLASHPEITQLEDLKKHPALVFTGDWDRWELRTKNQRVHFEPSRAVCSSNLPPILLDLAIRGAGVALLPEFLCLEAIQKGKLKRVLPSHSTELIPVSFVWPGTRDTNPKVRAFIDLAMPILKTYFRSRS